MEPPDKSVVGMGVAEAFQKDALAPSFKQRLLDNNKQRSSSDMGPMHVLISFDTRVLD